MLTPILYRISKTLLFFFAFSSLLAQKVINSTGNSVRLETYTLSYSVGETAIQTLKSSNGAFITQGVLQPIQSLIPSKPIVTLPFRRGVCLGESIDIEFSTFLLFQQDNEFSIELSDEQGSFNNPTVIGKVKGTTLRKVPVQVPSDIKPVDYLIRVVSSNPKEIAQTTNLLVRKKPSANFSIPASACTGDTVYAIFTGKDTIKNSNFVWNFSDGLLVKKPTGQQGNIWSIAGSKNVSLSISNDGCLSDKVEQKVNVERRIAPAQITCGTPSGNSITFNWAQVGGATAYKTRVISGSTEEGIQKGYSLTFSNVTQGTKIKIEVQATGPGTCGFSVDTQTCTTIICPNLTASLTQNRATICAGEAARTSLTLSGGRGVYQAVYSKIAGATDTLKVLSGQLFDFFPEQNTNYTFLAVGSDGFPGCFSALNKPVFQVTVTPNNFPGKPEAAPLACNNQDNPIILNDLLKDEWHQGKWRSATPLDSNSFDSDAGTFIPKGNNPGKYYFIYTVEGKNGCKERESSVEVRLEQKLSVNITTYANCTDKDGRSIISLKDVSQRANPQYPNLVRWYIDSTLKNELKVQELEIANKRTIYTKVGQGACASSIVAVTLSPNDSSKLQLPIIQGPKKVKLGDTLKLSTNSSYPSGSLFVWKDPKGNNQTKADLYQLPPVIVTNQLQGKFTLQVRAPQTKGVKTCESELGWIDIEVIDETELDLNVGKLVNSSSVWKIEGLDAYPKHKIQVFNRWGELVYQKSGDYTNDWHGECKENCTVSGMLPHGTYYYIIQSGISGDKKAKKGALYIIE